MIPHPPEFLVVEADTDTRFLLSKTILRKFPQALIHEREQADAALSSAEAGKLTSAIVHDADDMEGTALVALLRESNPTLPILAVSCEADPAAALRAGASGFLLTQEWLRVGTVVDDLIIAARQLARRAAHC